MGIWGAYGDMGGEGGSVMRIRLGLRVLACLEGTYLEANLAPSFSFPFLSCIHLHYYLRPPIQNKRGFLLIMHSRFIFLFLLHGAIANPEIPSFRTDNLFPPLAPDLLPVTAVASVESTSTAASGSASQAFEARGGDGEYEHHRTGREATFPVESSFRLVFNDGAFDSVPSNAMPEEGRSLVRKYDHSSGQMSPPPAGIFSGEGEGINRRSVSPTPPYPDQSRSRSLAPLDGEHVSEDVDGGANSRNEYPPFTSDNIFGPVVKGPTRSVTTRSESRIKEGLDQEEWFREGHFRCLYLTFVARNQFRSPLPKHKHLRANAPTFGSLRTGDPLIAHPKNVIRSVSSAEIARDEVYKLERGDDGAMRSVLVERLDANLGIQPGPGVPIRFVEISRDGEVYIVGATSPTKGIEEVEVQYALSI